MKRLIYFSLIFLVGTLSAQSKKQIKELKIKSMTETTSLYKDGKETASYKSEYKLFDKEGNTIQDIEYNPDGSIKRKETSKYSGKDKIEEVVERPNGGSDEGDNTPPKKYKKTTWKYNAKGDKIEEVVYDASGTILSKTTFAYNAAGDKMFEMEYDASGRILKKTAYGYDSKGLRTERKVFGPGGEILEKVQRYTYTY